MTMFSSFGESSIPDNPGFKHLLLTCALCAPSVLWAVFLPLGSALGLDRVFGFFALPFVLFFFFHWWLTFAGAASALALSLRQVSARKKQAAWVAVAVAVLIGAVMQRLTVW